MDTAEVVTSETSKEAVELKANPVASVAAEPVSPVVEIPTEPVAPEGETPAEEKKPEEENSVIRQMRKQMKMQAKQIAELRNQAQAQPEPAPVREAFATDQDYIQAEVAHQIKQTVQVPVVANGYDMKFEEAKKTHPDFEDALDDISHVRLPILETRQAIETLQYGSEILYHLAKNPDLAEEISILPPAAYAAKLGELHADIRRAKTTKQVSKAPAPIAPVGGSAKVDKSYDDITDQTEFVARRRKEREAYNRSKAGY